MTRVKHSIDGKNLAIIAETPNINYFLKTALEPDSTEGVVNKSSRKKEHKRRKYVGDPAPSNIPEHPYEFMYDPGRIDLQTLPGKSFILDDGTERRQMTYVGDVMDLHAFLVGDAKMDLKLYTQGPPYEIKAAGETQPQAVKAR